MSVQDSQTTQNAQDDEIDLAELWGRLLDHRKLIILTTLVVFALGCVYANFATRIYQANTLLQIEPKKNVLPSIGELSDVFSSGDSVTQTEIQIIQSRLVLGSAIDQLHMAVRVRPEQSFLMQRFFPAEQGDNPVLFAGWQGAKMGILLAKFYVPENLLGTHFQLKATGDQQYSLSNDEKVLLKGTVGQAVKSPQGIQIKVASLDAPKGSVFDVVRLPQYQVIQHIHQRLKIAEQGQKTGILQLTYTDPLPARAVAVLNAIDQSYLLQNIQRSSAQARESLEFVNQQLPKIKEQLEAAESKLNQYRQASDSVDISLKTKSLLKRVVAIETQINALHLKESEVASLYTKSHPTYQSLLKQIASLESDKKRLEKQISKLPETQQDVLRLTRAVKTKQQVYMQMLNRAQELKIAKASTVGNVRIIDKPIAGAHPIKPKTSLILAVSLLLGLMLSVGYVFLKLALRHGLETPEELEQLGLPVYATLPLSIAQHKMDKRQRGFKHNQHAAKHYLLAIDQPGDIAIESLRSLRTSLHFAMLESGNRVLVTSASPGVGKSFVSANLAAVLASSGKKVLLIEADMRRGRMHEIFGVEDKRIGLSSILSGQLSFEEAVVQPNVEGLSILPRGQVPPNPAELLMHPRMDELLESASNAYDIVLIDTPPILAVTDAAILGQKVGAILMVARYQRNTPKEMDIARQRFEKNGLQPSGCIFNCVERQSNNYYHYDYEYRSRGE